MIDLWVLVILIIATEAATEIVVASDFPLFLWFRTRLAQWAIPDTPRDGFWQRVVVAIHKLFTCGYCFSVWTAAFFALFAPILFGDEFINWLCFTFVLHRTANWIHVIYELVKKGRVDTKDLTHEVVLKIVDENGFETDD